MVIFYFSAGEEVSFKSPNNTDDSSLFLSLRVHSLVDFVCCDKATKFGECGCERRKTNRDN